MDIKQIAESATRWTRYVQQIEDSKIKVSIDLGTFECLRALLLLGANWTENNLQLRDELYGRETMVERIVADKLIEDAEKMRTMIGILERLGPKKTD